MPLSISIGPLSLPTAVLLLFISVVLGLVVARLVGRGQTQSATDALLLIVLTALLFGRLIFVLRFADSYQSVWQMLDFRDRGIDPGATVLAALVLTAVQFRRHKELKKAILSGVIIAALCLGAGSFWLHSQQQQQVLADITLESLAGYPVALTDLAQGKPVVINIWASWCPPCHREMPYLLAAEQQHQDVRFIMINLQENRATVQEYLRKHQLHFGHVLLDTRGDVASYYGAQGVPATLFFNADGTLSSAHFGEVSKAILQQGIAGAYQ
ncbi:TlpA family protein disulfide reductase [Rheinheimera fenheensis]|uniref:TlpA family protein disulfide reductase n=1 Tax=Rheinheimera fenheensis TaxID=3152295 RepID=UPI00325F4A5B